MTNATDDADRELLQLVALAFEELDPVPEAAVARASRLLAWRSPDADIAYVLHADDELVQTRGVDAAPGQSFESSTHRIELTVGAQAIVGSIEPWSGGRGLLEFDGGSSAFDVGDDGEFQIPLPPVSLARLRFGASTGEVVTTAWFLVTRDRSS